ncbi:Protein of unknown function (DUF3292) domain containing protein [Naviculisporaceae sp. PSN 640]
MATMSEPRTAPASQTEAPTISHRLANNTVTSNDGINTAADSDYHARGQDGVPAKDNGEVKDLGWHEVGDSGNLPEPLMGKSGLGPDPDALNDDGDTDEEQTHLAPVVTNEELFTLIRRFNKHIIHVKCTHDTAPLTTGGAGFDLEVPPKETFTVFKFRTRLEQFYMTVGVGLISAYKHLVRLRSWREYRRTACFCIIYSLAWFYDSLLFTFFTFLLVLIVYPPSRRVCFPHAPPALIDPQTGGLKKPMTNVLASDSMTGAPESHPGEAIEQEAHSFVNSIVELAIGLATGESPEKLANIKDKTGGDFVQTEHDKTKKPVSDAVWEEALPAMHLIGNVADLYERVGNALDPRWPFSKNRPKVAMAGVLVPIIIACWFLSGYLMVKGVGLVVGFALFGDPVLRGAGGWLDRAYPLWRNYVSLKATILKGVPTNAQLALTLLRIGERNHAPLPPPPGNNDPLPMEAHPTAGEGLDKLLNVSPAEVDAAVQPSFEAKEEADGNLREEKADKKSRAKSRLLGGVKHVVRGLVNTVRGADKLAARVDISQSARYRAGVVRTGPLPARCTGPVRFPARKDGKRGYAVIQYNEAAEGDAVRQGAFKQRGEAVLGWVPGEVPEEGDVGKESDSMKWSIKVADICEIQKIGGLGWKSKILVGWAMDGEITDGLIIRDEAGTEYHLTAISFRDELFNRLVAIGQQAWESW